MLFHLLGDGSIELWKRQIDLILDKNGLVSFIAHPDYVMHDDMKGLYKELLNYLRELPAAKKYGWRFPQMWIGGGVHAVKYSLYRNGNEWRIEGEGADGAVLAYAPHVGSELAYELEPALTHSSLH